MPQEIGERVAVTEDRIKQHDNILAKHGDQIDALMHDNVRQDSKLNSLCHDMKENTEISRSIKGAVDTVKWLVAGVSTLGGLWLMVKQLGWF